MLKINHEQAIIFTKMILSHEDTSAIARFATNGKAAAYNINGSRGGFSKINKHSADFLRSVADALETRDD